jgi:hypothetical protein
LPRGANWDWRRQRLTAAVATPGDQLVTEIGRTRHPLRESVVFLVDVSAQQNAVAALIVMPNGLLDVVRRDALLAAAMADFFRDVSRSADAQPRST